MPATDFDLDHGEAWANGGPTTENNLALLCRHDHIVRHHAGNSSGSTMAPTNGPADSVTPTSPAKNPRNGWAVPADRIDALPYRS
ncbi:MAG: HNH endonuclease signature motif containing protein [Acidimicrobiia bacterium]